MLRRALDRLESELGLKLLATFEQEFIYSGVPEHPGNPMRWTPFGAREHSASLLAALQHAKVIPDSFLSEYGPQQFEVTSAPVVGLRAADNAVITREITRRLPTALGSV